METIRIETDPRGVATLILSRPERHNAMSATMISELSQAAARLGTDETVRAVVLTGAGRSFSAGADLAWMRTQFDADRAARIEEAMALARMLFALNTMNRPLIGRINGQAFGGGLGLMAVCDVAVGIDGARFAFTETRLGIVPATISPYVLSRMGEGLSRRVFMSGRVFDGREAVTLGLMARAVGDGDLDTAVEAEIAPYLTCDPGAVARAKRLARSLGPVIDESVMRRTAETLADAWESPQARARIGAFLDKSG